MDEFFIDFYILSKNANVNMDDENLKKPVFIVCQHRTGSTLLKNMLDCSPDLAMATDEMAVSCPWRKTFLDLVKEIGNLENEENIERLIEIIYSKEVYGKFWRDYPELNIEKKQIRNKILQSNRSAKSIVCILLGEYQKLRAKSRIGVKFMVHYSRIELLYEWFPDCKILFLTRDPRAMTASKLNSEGFRNRKRKYPYPFAGLIIHYLTLGYSLIEFRRSSKIYQKYKKFGNIFHVKYESLIKEPDYELKKICEFCDIQYSKKMLKATGKYSSHGEPLTLGPDVKRLILWKERLSKFDELIINLLSKKAMARFSYVDIDQNYDCLERRS